MSPKKLSLILTALSISGCVTHYTPPENTPQAMLSLSTGVNRVRVQVFDDEKCNKSPYGNRLVFFNGIDSADRIIPADKEFFYTFVYNHDIPPVYKKCNITLGFTPKPGERYKTRFSLDNGKCVAYLTRARNTPAGIQYLPEESTRQITPACPNILTD